MARIQPLTVNEIDKKYQDLFLSFSEKFFDFKNQIPIYAHCPEGMKHIFEMTLDIQNSSTLPKRLVEIAVVAASHANKCNYCVTHHSSILKGLGLDKNTISSIASDNPKNLTEAELLVHDYAIAVSTRAWGISEKMFDQLRSHFNNSEIVTLTVRIALTGLFNKINQALEIEIESDLKDL